MTRKPFSKNSQEIRKKKLVKEFCIALNKKAKKGLKNLVGTFFDFFKAILLFCRIYTPE